MQEKQVTLGKETYRLPHPFLVLATQNPIEQEGTYTLPEAQVDRFMFKLKVGYPSMEDEHQIMRRMARSAPKTSVEPVIDLEDILETRGLLDKVFIDEKVEKYILRLVDATRNPSAYGIDISRYLRFGASPRATIFLSLAARGWRCSINASSLSRRTLKTLPGMFSGIEWPFHIERKRKVLLLTILLRRF